MAYFFFPLLSILRHDSIGHTIGLCPLAKNGLAIAESYNSRRANSGIKRHL